MEKNAVKFYEVENFRFYRLPSPISVAPDGWKFEPTRYALLSNTTDKRAIFLMNFNRGYSEVDLINDVVGCIKIHKIIHEADVSKNDQQLISELLAYNGY